MKKVSIAVVALFIMIGSALAQGTMGHPDAKLKKPRHHHEKNHHGGHHRHHGEHRMRRAK